MSVAVVHSMVLKGFHAHAVEVEAQVSPGLPALVIVGLADTAVKESRERVRAALVACGLKLPPARVTVNLSPASVHKNGTGLDLALALAIAAAGNICGSLDSDTLVLAEIRLDGRVQPVRGILALTQAAYKAGFTKVIVAGANSSEAEKVAGMQVIPVTHLSQIINSLGSKIPAIECEAIPYELGEKILESKQVAEADLSDYIGNESARYGLEVAAAGKHNLLMTGPPGCGKTMLASLLPGILPELSLEQSLEVSALHSLAGTIDVSLGIIKQAPFRFVHQSITPQGLLGGGAHLDNPGEITLAHHGVLFLDEIAEFPLALLQSLRQPLESGKIVLKRVNASATFPCRFQFVAASNICPCGKWGAEHGECECSSIVRRRYLSRLSGPLLDRVDIQLSLRPPRAAMLARAGKEKNESSACVARRVQVAREMAAARLQSYGLSTNSEVPGQLLRTGKIRISACAVQDLERAYTRKYLSLRSVDRVMRLAWTVSDLQGKVCPQREDVMMALSLRTSDEQWS